MRVLFAMGLCAHEQCVLNGLQCRRDVGHEPTATDALFFFVWLLAAPDEHRILFHVAGSDLEANRHAFLDPMPDLLAATFVSLIDDHADRAICKALSSQFLSDPIAVFQYTRPLIVRTEDRNDDHLRRR